MWDFLFDTADPAVRQAQEAQGVYGNINEANFQAPTGAWEGSMGQARGQTSLYGDQMMGMLSGLASGQGPSLAQEQLRQGTQNAMAGQQAAAAGGGPNAALMATNAANNMANLQAGQSGQAAQLRMQEQLGALQGMGAGISSLGQLENERLRQQLQAAGMAQQGGMAREQLRAQQQGNLFNRMGTQPSNADRTMSTAAAGLGFLSGMF